MSSPSPVALRARRDGFLGAGVAWALLGVSGLFATSCLTPDFSFGPDPGADGADGETPSCTDRRKNGSESDIDCGGDECDPCGLGQTCVVPRDCTQPEEGSNATVACVEDAEDPEDAEKRCTIQCARGQADCNGNASDGCEVHLGTDDDNCGACGVICGGPSGTHLESASCEQGECVVACEPGWCSETGNPELTCSGELGTTAHCRTCDEVCSTGQPYCDSLTGCRATLRIELVNDETFAQTDPDNPAEAGSLIFQHDLETSRGENALRAVVVLAGYIGNANGAPTVSPVTYAGKTMLVATMLHSGNLAGGGIYYLLDADLPASKGNKTVVLESPNTNDRMQWMAQVLELKNVSKTAEVLSAQKASGGSSCSGLNLSLAAVPPGSWVLSNISLTPNATLSPLSEQTAFPVQNITTGPNHSQRSGGFLAEVSGDTSMNWSCSGSNQWAHLLAAFSPEGT